LLAEWNFMTNIIPLDESLWSPAEVHPRFEGRKSQAREEAALCSKQTPTLFLIGFFLGFIFDPEDEGSMFFRNVGELLQYMTFRPRRSCENPKSSKFYESRN
jgi:hypothetical protein